MLMHSPFWKAAGFCRFPGRGVSPVPFLKKQSAILHAAKDLLRLFP
jgi:hypothetical protein